MIKEGNDNKEQPTVVEFCSYKWVNPLDYMDGKYRKEMCLNKNGLLLTM